MANGQATIVSKKAIGQANANWAGQAANHSAVGPSAIKDMMPDIAAAIMKVIRSWEISMVFLFIIQLSLWTGGGAERTLNRPQHHPSTWLAPWVHT